MSFIDKAKNTAQSVVGDAKERLGKHNDDPDLVAEGREDQAEGSVKNAGEHLKDAGNDVKDAFKS
jgi:uncharacterized protein YjbJ (UPF0337 family)